MSKVSRTAGMSTFSRYLTLWVLICMVIGVAIGYYFPAVPNFLGQFEFYLSLIHI